MSLSVLQGERITVITITPNPSSKWPILCQILGALCYSPVCSASQHLKSKMTDIYTALGIVQIMVGIFSLVTWIFFLRSEIHNHVMIFNGPFWLGAVSLVVGIVSVVVVVKFPSYFLLHIAVVLNKLSAVLAMIGFALYLWDLMNFRNTLVGKIEYENYIKMIRTVLDVTMMIFSAIQLCVALSFSVLTVKEVCETDLSAKDPKIYKPLKEEVVVSHV